MKGERISIIQAINTILSNSIVRGAFAIIIPASTFVGGFVIGAIQDYSSINDRINANTMAVEPIPQLIENVQDIKVTVETILAIISSR